MNVQVPYFAALGILVGTALASPLASAASQTISKPLSAQVSVDASGQVTDVALTDDKVSAAITTAVEKKIKGLSFVPAQIDGTPGAALTFVALDVCAIPSGDGFDLAVNYVDNGPLLVKEDKFEFPYAVDMYGGAHLYAVIKLKASADGRAQLQDISMVDVAQPIQHDLHLMVKNWVATLRFKPEQIGGHPVATDIEWPVEWYKLRSGTHAPSMHPVVVAIPGNSPECPSTRKPNDLPSSIASPVRLVDVLKPAETSVPAK